VSTQDRTINPDLKREDDRNQCEPPGADPTTRCDHEPDYGGTRRLRPRPRSISIGVGRPLTMAALPSMAPVPQTRQPGEAIWICGSSVAWPGRKPIRRGRYASSSAMLPGAGPTFSCAWSDSRCLYRSLGSSSVELEFGTTAGTVSEILRAKQLVHSQYYDEENIVKIVATAILGRFSEITCSVAPLERRSRASRWSRQPAKPISARKIPIC
jgi:hypothetical protein